MKKALLILPDHWFYYQFNDDKIYNHYSSNPSKGFKVFNYICNEKSYDPYLYVPKGKDSSKFKSKKIKLVREENIRNYSFEFVYVYKDFSLNYFNELDISFKKAFLFVENYNQNLKIEKIDGIGCCSLNEKHKYRQKKSFRLLNICNGKRRVSVDEHKEKRVIYIGRAPTTSIRKIRFLAQSFPKFEFHLYITRIINGATYFRVDKESVIYSDVSRDIKKIFPEVNCIIKQPLSHENLYDVWNNDNYAIGFVPSIYDFNNDRKQKNSSSKFYDYIGAGIPVLIENLIPESKFIQKGDKKIGIKYANTEHSLAAAFEKISTEKFSKIKISEYANRKHFEDSRGKLIIKEMEL